VWPPWSFALTHISLHIPAIPAPPDEFTAPSLSLERQKKALMEKIFSFISSIPSKFRSLQPTSRSVIYCVVPIAAAFAVTYSYSFSSSSALFSSSSRDSSHSIRPTGKMEHPFLSSSFNIPWFQMAAEHVVPDMELAIEHCKESIELICANHLGAKSEEGGSEGPGETKVGTFESTFLALESAQEEVSRAWTYVDHLDSVMNAPALREAKNAVLPKVTDLFSSIPLNERLYTVMKVFYDECKKTGEIESMSQAQKRLMDETVNDFEKNGANLPPAEKEQLTKMNAELAQITQKYSENVLDSTNAFELMIENEEDLRGLPPTAVAAARQSAEEKGQSGKWRLSLHMPSYIPVMKYLDSSEIRRKLWEGMNSVGGGKGETDNSELIWKILDVRRRKAKLLGKKDFADFVLERRMAKNGERVDEFVSDLHDKIDVFFKKEVCELEEYVASKTGKEKAEELEPWDLTYWAEKMRKERYDLDDEALRPYFAVESVVSGLFKIFETLYNLEIRSRPTTDEGGDFEVWHKDVKCFDVFDVVGVKEDGSRELKHRGSFYADFHPRDGKRSGAWMNPLITGAGGEPHSGLICANISPPVDGKPALITHDEVETLFHEAGHLMHHLMGDVEIKSLNGIHIAWDAVELPSQIMVYMSHHL
jgi:oligopeptidase A